MICTGQRSAASRAQLSSSAKGEPSEMLPLSRNFSIIWLKVSSGFCSNNKGHVSEHVPQLVQFARSIITFTKHSYCSCRNKNNSPTPGTTDRLPRRFASPFTGSERSARMPRYGRLLPFLRARGRQTPASSGTCRARARREPAPLPTAPFLQIP